MSSSSAGTPMVDESTQEWWAAVERGELLLPKCGGCHRLFFYPRRFCPFCWSGDVGWQRASGRGVVYTFSTIHLNDVPPFAERVPYTVAVVELEEGPRLEALLVDCPDDALEIGLAVEVVFGEPADGPALPSFRPREATVHTG